MVTSSQELILSVVPAMFTGRLPIKGSWVEINRDE
jgi:predicted small secreted protein